MTVSLRLELFLDRETLGHVRLQSPAGLLEAESFAWPLPAALLDRIDRWRRWDENNPVDHVQLGRDLFDTLIGAKVRTALAKVVAEQKQDRVLIAIRDVDIGLADLPLELLHDGQTFLQGGNRVLYREIRDFAEPRPSRRIQRVLVVCGEPTDNRAYPIWGRDEFVAQLKDRLSGASFQCTFASGGVEELQQHLVDAARANTPFDLIILVAHGEAGRDGGDGHLLLDRGGVSETLSAAAFARMTVEHSGAVVAMVSCYGAGGSRDNPFGSVGRNVARDGGASAVVAMTRKVTIEAGLIFCKGLIDCFAAEDDSFEAFARAMAVPFLGNQEEGTVCLLSATPTELSELDDDKAVIRELFNLEGEKDCCVLVSLPSFRMGLPSDRYEQFKEIFSEVTSGEYRYSSYMTSFPDMYAAEQMLVALSRLWSVDEVGRHLEIVNADNLENRINTRRYTHFVVIGTRSHARAAGLFKRYSDDFEFQFDKTEWRIVDKRGEAKFTTPDPSRQSSDAPDQRFDYALIEKIVLEEDRCMFFIAGLWDTSTQAAAEYLVRERKFLVEQFGAGGFQIVLQIIAGTTQVKGLPLLSRRPSEPT